MLAPKEFDNHWVENLPPEIYHADLGSVSSTGLRKILKSPRTFQAGVLLGDETEATDAMKFGTLVHQVVLEGADFLKKYVIAPEFIGLTKDGRESNLSKEAREKKVRWYADQESEGHIVVTQNEFDDIRGMLDSVIAHPDAFALLKEGVTEVSGYYVDPETGILCRIRPDFYSKSLRALVDLKTTMSVEEYAFSKTIWKFRYDVQMAMYGEGIALIEKAPPEFTAYIGIEKTKPYECAVYIADDGLLGKGSEDYHNGLRILRRCIDRDEWPGYQTSSRNISLPPWALNV